MSRKVQYLNSVSFNQYYICFSIRCIMFHLLQRLQLLIFHLAHPNLKKKKNFFYFRITSLSLFIWGWRHYLCSFIDCRLLWEFIYQLLQNPCYKEYVCWEKLDDYVFRINNPTGLAQLWGHQKNRTNMTYEKLSRALRYYYRMNIIKKVSGKRLTYK